MEDLKKRSTTETDKEIVFSKAIKAGKRIYYLDVRKNRKDEMFLAITESKKVVNCESESPSVSFEKHKIFLYKEDFGKFMDGINEAIGFINNGNQINELNPDGENEIQENSGCGYTSGEIKIDIDF